jgi:protein involved in polysaccharide export with SLBB domain
MNNTFAFLSLSLALAVLTGCRTESNVTQFDPHNGRTNGDSLTVKRELDAKLLQPSRDFFTLGPGDEIQVELLGKAGSRADIAVGPDGKIYFDLLPAVDVWGLTIAQTKALLEKELEKYVTGPQVSVTLRRVGSKYVWVLGKVNRPGVHPTATPMTLLEAMSLAGGTSRSGSQVTTVDLADLRHAFVIRRGQALPVDFHRLLEEGDMSQNVYLEPDDFVYVPPATAREIYVFGAVRLPRAMPLSDHPTLVSAIAAGGGPIRDAYLSHVAIVRGSLSSPTIAIVDLKEIVKGQAADVQLEPHDIVYVPYAPYRFLRLYLEAILGTFVNTVAANEGANAFGGGNIGVSVPVTGP